MGSPLDAIRPWFHRSWIYPRDPKFIKKLGEYLIFMPDSGAVNLLKQMIMSFVLTKKDYIK